MQLEIIKHKKVLVKLFLLIALVGGCRSPTNHAPMEIVDLAGDWMSYSTADGDSKNDNYSVSINIDKNGNGEFTSYDKEKNVYTFKFEIMLGTDKVGFFSDDGRQFIYNYRLNGDELRLENAVDSSLILLNRKSQAVTR